MLPWTRYLIKHARWVILFSFILSVFGIIFSVHLFGNLKTDVEELLPSKARSVLDMNEVRSRLESSNNISILIFSDHPEESRHFVDDVAAEIQKLPKDVAASVEYRIDKELAFFNERKSLFVEQPDLESIKHFVKAKIDYETQLYNPLTIIENKDIPEPRLDLKSIEQKYTSKVDNYSRFQDGYYSTPDQKIRVIIVNSPGASTGMDAAKNLRKAIDDILKRVKPENYANDIKVQFTGGIQDVIEEHEALIEDLAVSTGVVCILVTIALIFYFQSLAGTTALLISLFTGTFVTFGVAFFEVGYLNANSAFMASIVIGNGINFGIILLARFLEERRKHKHPIHCIAIAVEKTRSATLVAAGAAGLSYGSLVLTSFRGFRQFGIIGFTGMVLCWISAYTTLPSLLVVFYSMGFFSKRLHQPKLLITNAVTKLVEHFPKAMLAMTALFTVFSLAHLHQLDAKTLIETDLKKLRNKRSFENGSIFWSKYEDQVFERYLAPIVVLPKKMEDIEPIANEIRKTKLDEGSKSFIVKVSTIRDFVPDDQDDKIKILTDIRKAVPKRMLERMSPKEQAMAKDLLSPESFKKFNQTDLPELVLSKFRERDGTIGKLILVEPSLSPELSQSANLIHFVGSIREAADRIEPGTAIAGSLPITSDMFESIVRDGPKATLCAFLAVFLLIVLLFRNTLTIAQCSFALLMGVLWLFGFILGFHEKINFLNFIALPITFGIGVDYGVNIFERYRHEKSRGILNALHQTGGAVMLSSFTTVTGYGSLLLASNQAFNSFGKLAVMGELTCVFAAVISLPSLLWYLELRKKAKKATA